MGRTGTFGSDATAIKHLSCHAFRPATAVAVTQTANSGRKAETAGIELGGKSDPGRSKSTRIVLTGIAACNAAFTYCEILKPIKPITYNKSLLQT